MNAYSREVLSHMDLENLIDIMDNSSSSHVEQEVNMLVDFNFKLVVDKRLQK
jgi:hypothetical protein